jgi:hypothetical protein
LETILKLQLILTHLSVFHERNCIFEDGVLLFTTDKITGDKKTYNSLNNIQAINDSTPKTQDNTNATNTTTNNMDSNRKHSHATAIHEEESKAKKLC